MRETETGADARSKLTLGGDLPLDTLANMLAAAYVRGWEWRGENPESEEYLSKASYDYTDKTMSIFLGWLKDQK
jgi:hypothetical protein